MPAEQWTPDELSSPDAIRLMNWAARHKINKTMWYYWRKRGWSRDDLVQDTFIQMMKSKPTKDIALSTACVKSVVWTVWRRSINQTGGKRYLYGDFYLRNDSAPMFHSGYEKPTWESDLNLHRALESLPKRNRNIIKLRFGFGCTPMTLEQIGKKLGVTRERVRQLEERGLQLLGSGHRRDMILGEKASEKDFVSQERVGHRWKVSGIYDIGR